VLGWMWTVVAGPSWEWLLHCVVLLPLAQGDLVPGEMTASALSKSRSLAGLTADMYAHQSMPGAQRHQPLLLPYHCATNCAGRHASDAKPGVLPTEGFTRRVGAVHSTGRSSVTMRIATPNASSLLTFHDCVEIVQVDTLVMQNLGYFQLKASPGLWELSIAPGRSRDLYQIVSATSGSALATGWGRARSPSSQVAGQELAESTTGEDYATQVLMHSFTGGCAGVPVSQLVPVLQNWGCVKPGSVGGAAFANTDRCKYGTSKAA
jgi:hypothetical protein